jgi:nucleoside-diphosphate-sugar epimerase
MAGAWAAGTAVEITTTNLLGTWHVLLAAERVAVDRVVFLSSVHRPLAPGDGAFVHADDVADACARALDVPVGLHARLLLATDGAVDATRAHEVLGWVPTHDRPPSARPLRA